MHEFQYKDIKITEDSKIIIALGDSFTQGQGAAPEHIWEKFNWDADAMYNNEEVIREEYEGSWVHQLCRDYMPGWIPVNMGQRGCGNRAAIKDIYLHPSLNLELAKEKIVIFMISGIERFDFIDKAFNPQFHFFSMWPWPGSKNEKYDPLWSFYGENIWSDNFGILELLLNLAEARVWCKANNAKLIITSAFSDALERNKFRAINRNDKADVIVRDLDKNIDWQDVLYPKGFNCMTDYLINLEERQDLMGSSFYFWAMGMEKYSPKGYFTKCAHPSYKGHGAIAECIYEFIQGKKYHPKTKII